MRRFRTVTVALALMLGLAPMTAGPASADSDLYIYPFWGGTVEVDVSGGQSAYIDWVWMAKAKGQVVMFIGSEETAYSLRDDSTGQIVWELSADAADTYWSAPYEVSTEEWGLECKKDTVWESAFTVALPELTPDRTYTLTAEFSNRHPANDGLQNCGWGHFNFPPISWTTVITIETT